MKRRFRAKGIKGQIDYCFPIGERSFIAEIEFTVTADAEAPTYYEPGWDMEFETRLVSLREDCAGERKVLETPQWLREVIEQAASDDESFRQAVEDHVSEVEHYGEDC